MEKTNGRHMKYRRFWIASGRCADCGRPGDGHRRCPKCRIDHNAWNTKRRRRFAAQGKCSKCGRVKEGEFKTCAPCRKATLESKRKSKERRRVRAIEAA